MSVLPNQRARTLVAILSAGMFLTALAFIAIHGPHRFVVKHAFAAESEAALAQHPGANPVLVELFTSEGCSDCPPAETLLAHLLHDQPVPSANIIALEEHVDYWDHLGWRDRFSSADITARQGEYTRRLHLDDNYTPQMIVDGTDQFVGSDSAHALRSIAAAARTLKPALTISSVALTSGHLNGTVSVTSASSPPRAALYAAVVQPTSSTRLLRGENGGHTLQHASTVLSLAKIGDAHAASAPIQFSLVLPPTADPANLAIVIFVQQPDQGPILAAASAGIVR